MPVMGHSESSYHTVPSLMSDDGWDSWFVYPLSRDTEVKGVLGPHMSLEMLCMEPGPLGSGLGESEGWR